MWRKIASAGQHCVATPFRTKLYWVIIGRTRPGMLRRVRLLVNAQRVDVEGSRAGVVILDQGIAQIVWSMLYSANALPTMSDLRSYIDCAHKVVSGERWVVILRCPEATLEKRLRQRVGGRSVLDAGGGKVTRRAIEALDNLRTALSDESIAHNSLHVMEIDGERSPEVICDEIIERIFPEAAAE